MPQLEVKPICYRGLFVRIGFSYHSAGNLHNPSKYYNNYLFRNSCILSYLTSCFLL